MTRSLPLLLAALATPWAAVAEAPLVALSINYACAGGAVLEVAYLNPAGSATLAVVGWGGRLVPMQEGPAASGARYVAVDAASGLVWHSKGNEGTLFHEAAGGDDSTLLSDCVAVGQ